AGRSADQPVELEFDSKPRSLVLSLVAAIESGSSELRAPTTWLPVASDHTRPLLARLPLRVARRGPSEGAILRIESGFPFGLVTATRRVQIPCSITALPRLVPERDLLSDARLRSQGRPQLSVAPSRMNARAQGSPVSLRTARPGDTLREVHLRASLRRGRWVAAERAEETDGRTTILLECLDRRSAHLKRGHQALEAAISVVASLCQRLTREGREVRVLIDRPLPPQEDSDAVPELRTRQILATARRTLPLLQSLARLTLADPLGPIASEDGAVIHVQAVLTLQTSAEAHALQVDPEGRILLPIPSLRPLISGASA
ncbi:MAG: DUF58 domain-containing protein, partial [Planctomycetota bacterium]